jgi:hypothetical protein
MNNFYTDQYMSDTYRLESSIKEHTIDLIREQVQILKSELLKDSITTIKVSPIIQELDRLLDKNR